MKLRALIRELEQAAKLLPGDVEVIYRPASEFTGTALITKVKLFGLDRVVLCEDPRS